MKDYLTLLAEKNLLPGLTRPCPNLARHTTYVKPAHCAECGGSNQVLVSDAEALVVLLDYCRTHSLIAKQYSEELSLRHPAIYKAWAVVGVGINSDGDTLAEAVAKALGLVKDG